MPDHSLDHSLVRATFAPSLRSCQLSKRTSSSWSSMRRPPECSASPCLRRYSAAPMK